MGPYVLVLTFVAVGALLTYLGRDAVASRRRKLATWLHMRRSPSASWCCGWCPPAA
jgi:hypothetical protein